MNAATAHTRTLSPNDEILRVLEAIGILALLTRETPAEIAAERKSLRRILESAVSKADEVQKRMAGYTSQLESRIAQLAKELVEGLNPPRIAKLLGESLRQCFQQSGLPDAASALDQSCSEMNSVQKQLVNMLREVAHPDIGVIAKVRSANASLLRSVTTRTQQMDDFLVRLEKQVWAIWLPVVAGAAQAKQVLTAPDTPPQALSQRRAPLRGDHITGELTEIYDGYMVHRRFSFRTQEYNPLLQSCVGNIEEMDQTNLERLNASGKASDILFFLSLLQADGMARTRFFEQALADTTPTKLRYGTEYKEEGKIDDSFSLGNVRIASHFYPTPHAPRSA
jgi:hypothetical protein